MISGFESGLWVPDFALMPKAFGEAKELTVQISFSSAKRAAAPSFLTGSLDFTICTSVCRMGCASRFLPLLETREAFGGDGVMTCVWWMPNKASMSVIAACLLLLLALAMVLLCTVLCADISRILLGINILSGFFETKCNLSVANLKGAISWFPYANYTCDLVRRKCEALPWCVWGGNTWVQEGQPKLQLQLCSTHRALFHASAMSLNAYTIITVGWFS